VRSQERNNGAPTASPSSLSIQPTIEGFGKVVQKLWDTHTAPIQTERPSHKTESERSYATFLHRLVEPKGKLHIDGVALQPGAGDPLATLERAARIVERREQNYGRYAVAAFFLIAINGA
jgi:hypothetical protein